MPSTFSATIVWCFRLTFPTSIQNFPRPWSDSYSCPSEKKTRKKFYGTTAPPIMAWPECRQFCSGKIGIGKIMNGRLLAAALAIIWLIFPSLSRSAEPVQKVRIGYPSAAVSTLPFDIAKEKGFYTKAGLDVEYIQMRTAIAPQAVLNGNINFFTSPQAGISAAVSGLPLVVVLVLYKDTPWGLITNKEINKPQDLTGKKIAISDLRSSPYYFARARFRK